MCSGQHSSTILLAACAAGRSSGYWQDDHPAQVAYRAAVARGVRNDAGPALTAIDGCGVATYAFPLRDVARAYALAGRPVGVPASDPRSAFAEALTIIRDAMLANPEMVGGTRDRLDTSLMKAVPGRIVSKGGMEALRGLGDPGRSAAGANGRSPTAATGMAIKIEDGDGYERGTWAATVEALRQAGVLDGAAAPRARPLPPAGRSLDPHGRVGAEAIPEFELAPVGELIG